MPRAKHRTGALDDLLLNPDLSKGEQIKDTLKAYVLDARDGLLLPSERVLAEHFGVARMTVRGAIDWLESQGLVRRDPGRGTFVQRPSLTHSEIFRSFSEDMRLRGMTPGAVSFKASVRKASRQVAARLGIDTGDPTFYIERIRTADKLPMALERTNLAAARFPKLLDHFGQDDSLYEVLGTVYRVQPQQAEQTISIATLSTPEARALEVAEGAPAFLIERLSSDSMGNPVEFGRSMYRGDRYVVQMHVSRPSL